MSVLATTAIVFLAAIVLSTGDFSFVGRVTSFIETRWQAGLAAYGIHFFSVRRKRFSEQQVNLSSSAGSCFVSTLVAILLLWLSDDCDLLLSMARLSLSV